MSPCNQWVRSSTAHIRCLRIIHHGRSDMFVTEQLLDCADIVAAFEKLSGKAVAQGVGGSMFRDSRRPDGFLYGLLDHRFIVVVPAGITKDGTSHTSRDRKSTRLTPV